MRWCPRFSSVCARSFATAACSAPLRLGAAFAFLSLEAGILSLPT